MCMFFFAINLLEYICRKKRGKEKKRKEKRQYVETLEIIGFVVVVVIKKRTCSLGIFKLIRKPIETFVKAVTTCCTCCLNVPITIS